jgi:hypothetical protein
MPAQDLPIIITRQQLHDAAVTQDRVRIRGTITATGDGYSARYRNTWLVIRTAGTHLRITASRTSQLGTAQPGDTVDLAARLTGIHDVARDHYHAERAQLINLQHAAAAAALQRAALLEPEGARA